MVRCTKCLMPETRPGISFNEEGVCSACQHYDNRKNIDWHGRWKELEELAAIHKKDEGYDCIIAVSGGKDSHFQVHTIKEKLGMNPLLVSVGDNFTMTEAGKHNIANIKEAFSCEIIVCQPNIDEQKQSGRYMFEKYGQPTWYVDRLIYTYPLWVACWTGIPLIFYGENISYEYGGMDDEETPSALGQVKNGVAAEIDYRSLGLKSPLLDVPPLEGLEPTYLSYFVPWNSYENYEFAKSVGFKDLAGEWMRDQHVEDYDQIDSVAYLVHPWLKYPKFGHAFATDVVSRDIRYGRITREYGIQLIQNSDPFLDPWCVEDFCNFYGYTDDEFWEIVDGFYNEDLFDKVDQGMYIEWHLKDPIK